MRSIPSFRSLSLSLLLLPMTFFNFFTNTTVALDPEERENVLSPRISESLSKSVMATAETTISFVEQTGSRSFSGYPSAVTTTDTGGLLSMPSRITRKSRIRRSKSVGKGKNHNSPSAALSTTRHQNSLHHRPTTTVSQSPSDHNPVFKMNSMPRPEHVFKDHMEQTSKRERSQRRHRSSMVEYGHENKRSSYSHETTEFATNSFEVETSGMSDSLGMSNYGLVSQVTPAQLQSRFMSSTSSPPSTFSTPFCPVGYFECVNPKLCVPQEAICNGKRDCPDGSDEIRCVNPHEKAFWDSFFQKRPAAELDGDDAPEDDSCYYKIPFLMTNVTRPKSGNDKAGTGVFQELLARDDCICSQEKIVCHNVHLPNLYDFPQDIQFLDLSGCLIDKLEFPRERFYQLETLVLSSCERLQLTTTTFSTLPSIRVLHLTGIELKRIPPSIFASNGNLKKLYLAHNHLTLDSQTFQGLDALEYLDLRRNRVTGEELTMFKPLNQLRSLHLSYNHIRHINADFFIGLSKLEMLSLTENQISTIDPGAFNHSPHLKHLYLSYNRLSKLENKMFCRLQSLLNLNLNNNGITRIEPAAFHCLDKLQSLNLQKNPFRELQRSGEEEERDPRKLFTNLAYLRHIYFDEWWMCWWAPHVRSCKPKGDGISSVENLLDNGVLRVCVWVMGLVGVVGNLFVIVSRLMIQEKKKEHSFYIKNLAFADLLMGLFLLSIAYHDISFRGHFIAYQHSWRHSLTCQLSGMLSTLSSESTVFILFLITLDRYLSIVRPFAERTSTLRTAALTCLILWLLCFLLSSAPFIPFLQVYFGGSFYSSNGLCLPLHIHNPYETGWEYSFFLFIVVNSIAFAFMCYAYWRMLRIIQASTTSIRSTQQKQDGLLVMRFGLLVLTDFMCWAPIIAIKIVAMCGVHIPADLNAWLAVFVLPVNSALNPILYTLSTKLFKQQVSVFTIGFRKRLGLSRNSSASSLLQNRISRSLQISMNSFMMLSTRQTVTGVVVNGDVNRRRGELEENSSLSSCGGMKKSNSSNGSSPFQRTTAILSENISQKWEVQVTETAIESS